MESTGAFYVKVKAKDIYDAESDWTTLKVTMSRENRSFIESHHIICLINLYLPRMRFERKFVLVGYHL